MLLIFEKIKMRYEFVHVDRKFWFSISCQKHARILHEACIPNVLYKDMDFLIQSQKNANHECRVLKKKKN